MRTELMTNETLTMPLLPLRGLTIFPHMLLHFDVGREKSIAALEYAMKKNQQVFLVAQRDFQSEEPSKDDLFKVGTVCRVRQMLRLPGDNIRVLVEGVCRARLLSMSTSGAHVGATVETLDETPCRISALRLEALMRKAQEAFEEYAAVVPKMTPEMVAGVISATEPGYLADFIAQNLPARYEDKQEILEEFDPVKRLRKLTQLLSYETEVARLETEIQDKVRYQMDKNQRDYYLREQIKIIEEELGEGEDLGAEVEEYIRKIEALHLDAESEEKLLKEARRLSKLAYTAPESGVIRNYLDVCLELPWNKVTKEKKSLEAAAKVLNADHYGLDKVKERVLEFLAVRILSKEPGSQVLCLVGPPGTGKTSVASSIARAMGRKYARLSLGGVRDEADIRGHRKTYIGAMPGRIMTALSQAGSKNCVLLLDEVDKMGNDFKGDPSSALLEVLDAGQNSAFRDHFIELPFDLSQVLFITTANTFDTIPRPLLDRMEVIEVGSYTDEEKLHIAKEHLLPKQMKKHGLHKSQLTLTDDTLRRLIECYTKEAGVRELERQLAALCRKTAKRVLTGTEKRITVDVSDLERLLGPEKFKRESRAEENEVGVVSGLAWTQVGGEILEVEAQVLPGSGKLELTGNLGDVMKESARAAITYIRTRADAFAVPEDFYKTKDIHIHFPEGAVPKDGPSAGITTATAVLSALTGRPVRKDVAMTGEITLRGRVLPIGGLKEKTMAAYRLGIQTVILPFDNAPDLEEIDPEVKKGLRFVPVRHMDQVVAEALLPVVDAPAMEEGERRLNGPELAHSDNRAVAPMQQ